MQEQAKNRGRDYDRTACEAVPRRSKIYRPKNSGQAYRPLLSSPERSAIVETAMALLTFLRSVQCELQNLESRAKHAIDNNEARALGCEAILQRYLMFQQLRKENPNVMLIPTADIEYAWICHILRTEQYWEDCQREGIPVAHSLIPLKDGNARMFVEAARATSLLWKKRFGPECDASRVPSTANNSNISNSTPNLTFSSLFLANEECIKHQFYRHGSRSSARKATFIAPNSYLRVFGPPPTLSEWPQSRMLPESTPETPLRLVPIAPQERAEEAKSKEKKRHHGKHKRERKEKKSLREPKERRKVREEGEPAPVATGTTEANEVKTEEVRKKNVDSNPAPITDIPVTFNSLIDIKISLTTEDLKADLNWLPSFEKQFNQVRNDCWVSCDDSSEFILSHLMDTYDRYLWLVRKYPNEMLAPSLAVDLMWHAHQLNPVEYKQACLKRVGFELNHRMWGQNNAESKSLETPSDLSADSTGLSLGQSIPLKSSDPVQRLWKEEFGVSHTEDHKYYSGLYDGGLDDEDLDDEQED